MTDLTHPQELTEQSVLDDHRESPIGRLEARISGVIIFASAYTSDDRMRSILTDMLDIIKSQDEQIRYLQTSIGSIHSFISMPGLP